MMWGDVRPGDSFHIPAGNGEGDLVDKKYLVTAVVLSPPGDDPDGRSWNIVKVTLLLEDGRVQTWSDHPGAEYFDDELIGRMPR